MHTVMWTFNAPVGMTRADIDAIIAATAHTYLGIPGLIRKYYALAEDGGSLSGIYLWESKAQADAFYTPEWVALVTRRWAGAPRRQQWRQLPRPRRAAGPAWRA
jgi:hypothetical protein